VEITEHHILDLSYCLYFSKSIWFRLEEE